MTEPECVKLCDFEVSGRHSIGCIVQEPIDVALLAGGLRIQLYAVIKDRSVIPPWVDHTYWMIRNSAEAALHTAEVWGGEALAVTCTQIWWPDGREYRTPWVPITKDDS